MVNKIYTVMEGIEKISSECIEEKEKRVEIQSMGNIITEWKRSIKEKEKERGLEGGRDKGDRKEQ